jgi:hypothetical protein
MLAAGTCLDSFRSHAALGKQAAARGNNKRDTRKYNAAHVWSLSPIRLLNCSAGSGYLWVPDAEGTLKSLNVREPWSVSRSGVEVQPVGLKELFLGKVKEDHAIS